jgi:hypothetical protein
MYVTPEVTIQDKEHDRNASPIHILIVQIGNLCHPFYVRLNAPLLVSLTDKRDTDLGPQDYNVLDIFWKEVITNEEEIAW